MLDSHPYTYRSRCKWYSTVQYMNGPPEDRYPYLLYVLQCLLPLAQSHVRKAPPHVDGEGGALPSTDCEEEAHRRARMIWGHDYWVHREGAHEFGHGPVTVAHC